MDTKIRPMYKMSTRNPLQTKRHIQTEGERMKKTNSLQKGSKRKLEQQSPYQTKQTLKKITRDKEGHYTMIKGSIQQEDVTTVNVYAPNIEAPQYIRQTLTDIKGEIDNNTIIVGDSNTPHTNGQIIKTEN